MIQVTIQAIVHATEDLDKLFAAFEMLGLAKDDFGMQETAGHFENPITVLSAEITKARASAFVERLRGLLSDEQKEAILSEMQQRTAGSKFYMRLAKQDLVCGNLVFALGDPIKIRIHTPVYNKKDTVKVFTQMLQLG